MSDQRQKEKIFAASDCLSEEVIMNYLHDRLSGRERHAVEKHLLDCPLCEEAIEGYALMQDNKELKVVAEVTGEKERRNVYFYHRWLAAAMVTAVLFCGGLYFINQELHDKQPEIASHPGPGHSKEKKEASSSVPATAEGPVAVKSEKETMNPTGGGQEEVKGFYDPSADEGTHTAPAAAREDHRSDVPLSKPGTVMPERQTEQEAFGEVTKNRQEEHATLSPASPVYQETKKEEVEVQGYSGVEKKSRNDSRQRTSGSGKMKARVEETSRQGIDADGLQDASSTDVSRQDAMEDALRLYSEGKYAEASAIYEKMLSSKNEVSDGELFYYAGDCHYRLKNYKNAIASWEKVVQGMKYFEEARWKKAEALISDGRKNEAKKLLEEIAAQDGKYKQEAENKLKELR